MSACFVFVSAFVCAHQEGRKHQYLKASYISTLRPHNSLFACFVFVSVFVLSSLRYAMTSSNSPQKNVMLKVHTVKIVCQL